MGRTFILIDNQKDGSNLTELNATDSVNNGFMDHADWMAHVMRYAVVMKYIKRKQVNNLLDVGCGRLQLLVYLWRNRCDLTGFEYTGIDLRAQKAWLETESLPQSANITLLQGNILSNLPVLRHDVVVCTEVLEHIDKDKAPALLANLRHWVSNEGTLFLSSPNLGGSETVAANHTAPDGTPREWTYDGKLKLIRAAGFEIESVIGTFIRLDNIPETFWNPYTRDIKEKLPNSFFRVFAAAAFPEQSNNAMFVCKPV